MKQLRVTMLFAIALLFPLFAAAQAPASFSYQALIRDADGKPIASKEVFVRASILKENVQDQSKAIYSETHNLNTTPSGLLTANIGTGNILNGKFEDIDWSTPTYLLIEVDLDGRSTFPIASLQQLLSVPYALYAPMSPEVKQLLEQQQQTIAELGQKLETLQSDFDQLTPETLSKRQLVTDIDGNVYPYTIINGKQWMTKSLVINKLNDGTELTYLADSVEWGKRSQTEMLTTYYMNDEANLKKYGRLYTYNVVKSGKLCPDGWNLPTLAELKELVKLYPDPKQWKIKDTSYWENPDEYTNESGFSARGGVNRDQNAMFERGKLKQSVIYWTQTESHDRMAYVLQFTEVGDLILQPQLKGLAGYVRCLKGEPKPDPKVTLTAKIEPVEAATWENDPSGTYTVGHWMMIKLNVNPVYKFLGWFDETGKVSEEALNPGASNTEGPIFIPDHDATLVAKFEKKPSEQKVKDAGGVEYTAKLIGTKLWLTTNLQQGSKKKATNAKNWTNWAKPDLNSREPAYMYKDFSDANKGLGIYANRTLVSSENVACPDGYRVPTVAEVEELKALIDGGTSKEYTDFAPEFYGYIDAEANLHENDEVAYYWVFQDGDFSMYFSIDKATKTVTTHKYDKNKQDEVIYSQRGHNIRCVGK